MGVKVFLYNGVMTQTSCGWRSAEENLGNNQTKFRKMALMKKTRKHLPRTLNCAVPVVWYELVVGM